MKLSLDSRVRQSDKVVSHQFEAAVYILDPRKNTIRVLNETASFIWNSIEKWQTVASVVNKIIKRFRVSRRKAETDVTKYLGKFYRLKYVSVASISSIS